MILNVIYFSRETSINIEHACKTTPLVLRMLREKRQVSYIAKYDHKTTKKHIFHDLTGYSIFFSIALYIISTLLLDPWSGHINECDIILNYSE